MAALDHGLCVAIVKAPWDCVRVELHMKETAICLGLPEKFAEQRYAKVFETPDADSHPWFVVFRFLNGSYEIAKPAVKSVACQTAAV